MSTVRNNRDLFRILAECESCVGGDPQSQKLYEELLLEIIRAKSRFHHDNKSKPLSSFEADRLTPAMKARYEQLQAQLQRQGQ